MNKNDTAASLAREYFGTSDNPVETSISQSYRKQYAEIQSKVRELYSQQTELQDDLIKRIKDQLPKHGSGFNFKHSVELRIANSIYPVFVDGIKRSEDTIYLMEDEMSTGYTIDNLTFISCVRVFEQIEE